jgi:predicted amidophosphoribosyltransferase
MENPGTTAGLDSPSVFPMPAVAAIAGNFCRSLLDAVLPRGCAGCERPDAVLCPECRKLLSRPCRCELRGSSTGFSYACGAYSDALRQAILAWKDHGDEECTGPFAQALAGLALLIGVRQAAGGGAVLVVPVPSSPRSVFQRGRWHMLQLVKRMSRLLRGYDIDSSAAPVLTMRGVKGKSVEMRGLSQRAGRVGGHMALRRGSDIAGALVILVDDIVTTGSTMRQCVGALRAGGATVLTALALAQAGDMWLPTRLLDSPEAFI